jgi:hypothetical protein
MTISRKLKEVLNVRLDEPLAKELARIAGAQGRSESEVARGLLGYGIEVVRKLQAQEFARPFSWQEGQEDEPWPGIVEVEARWRPMTEEEIDTHGLRGYVGYPVDQWEAGTGSAMTSTTALWTRSN